MQPPSQGAWPINLLWLAGVSTALDNHNFIKCPSPSPWRGGDCQARSGEPAARQGPGGFGAREAGGGFGDRGTGSPRAPQPAGISPYQGSFQGCCLPFAVSRDFSLPAL